MFWLGLGIFIVILALDGIHKQLVQITELLKIIASK